MEGRGGGQISLRGLAMDGNNRHIALIFEAQRVKT